MTFKTPHLEVVKASFTDLNGYLIWRQAWRAHYRALSAEIRILKKLMSNVYRGADKCTETENAFTDTHYKRFVQKGAGYEIFQGASFLSTYRFEARLLCEQRVESKPKAAAMWKPRQQPVEA